VVPCGRLSWLTSDFERTSSISYCIASSYHEKYDTTRDAILTCDQKLTKVSLIYCTKPKTKKKCKKIKKIKSKKLICSEVAVNSPGNPWSQFWRRKGRLWWDGFAEKERLISGVKEWEGDGWWEWWVDGTDGSCASHTNRWIRIADIGAWSTERSRKLILETRGSIRQVKICGVDRHGERGDGADRTDPLPLPL